METAELHAAEVLSKYLRTHCEMLMAVMASLRAISLVLGPFSKSKEHASILKDTSTMMGELVEEMRKMTKDLDAKENENG